MEPWCDVTDQPSLDGTATALRFYLSSGWAMAGPPQPGFGVTTRNPMRKAVTVAPTARSAAVVRRMAYAGELAETARVEEVRLIIDLHREASEPRPFRPIPL
jgi:hypothetical protein